VKVLLVDKHLVDSVNYYKWNLLADNSDVTLKGITPERWKENFRTIDYRKVEDAKFEVEPLPVFWPGYENRGFYTKGLIKAIKKEQPDVIICMEEPCSLFALQVTIAVKLARSTSKVLFYSWYNLDPHIFYSYKPKFLYDWIIKYTLMHTDGVLCANNEALEFYSNRIGEKATKLYFGVNLQLFRQADSTRKSNLQKGIFRIGYIGRMMEMKNIETLIDAVASLRHKHNIQLRLLGNGDYKPFLKDYVKQKGVEDIVEFSEAVPGDKVGAYMRELDIQVLPSKSTKFWQEQYGRVLIEAMAAGVPSIGSSSGAIPEVIGDAGLIFEEQNSKDLSEKIEKLIVNPALLEQLSAKCLERANLFSSEKFADDIHQILKKLL
jgi:L-malate glycosyltransferase